MPLAVIVSTYPDPGAARAAARRAVGSGLAACVNMARASSVYEWKGRVCEEEEVIAVFKTTAERAAALKESIAKDHPYEVPELLDVDAESSGPYMDWVAGAVR